MYYSAGTYEAFAHPEKPKGVDRKSAYIIGTGLAGLTAAFYLVRDGQMKGERIHLLEKLDLAGGSCDGRKDVTKGFYMRGGREMDNHFEVMWDTFRDVPSLETPGVSVLDEYYWLNKHDPNYSMCRATEHCGQDAHTDGQFKLDKDSALALSKLFLTPESALEGKKISEVMPDSFWNTNFWLYWQTMFAFQKWSSALEMKRYLCRYVHHIDGLPDFSALRFTRYNQYESIILPMVTYLKDHGVQFHYETKVVDVKFDINGKRKQASSVVVEHAGETSTIDLTENDLLFITNGGCVESCTVGAQDKAAGFDPTIKPGNGWDLWKKIAAQDPAFGHPEKFCSDPEHSNWESATITTLDDKIPQYIQKICKRDPFSGHTVTGGIVTVKDSNWLLSWTLNRQQQFRDQPKNQLCVWVYGLFSDKPGNYVKKAMRDCTGKELCMEWLYHIGVPEAQIEELAEHSANTVPVMMPYIDAFFMPRAMGDRPDIVPEGAVNFAFLGQFAETARDTIFTTEYSMRTGMEAVYTLLNIDRGVPEVWGSTYDVRALIDATVKLRDGKKITDMDLPLIPRLAMKEALKKIEGTDLEKFLKEYNAI